MSIYIGNDLEDRLEVLEVENASLQVHVPQNSRVPQNIQKQFLHHNF